MNIASIDVGTNTILLLIADISSGNFSPIINRYEIPRIGRGLKPGEKIPEENIKKMLDVFDSYNETIKKFQCKIIKIVATNALRIASNSLEIKKIINDRYGYEIDIITGLEEARLSFLGASSALPGESEKLIVDIGGGSTELIHGDGSNLRFSKSYLIGAVSLTEKFFSQDPPTSLQIENSEKFIDAMFEEISGFLPPNPITIAVAGTPTTLACLNKNLSEYNEDIIEGSILTKNDLDRILNKLKTMNSVEILKNFGTIVKGREDVLLAGSLILKRIMGILELKEFIISGRGIRYGSVINFLNQEENGKSGR